MSDEKPLVLFDVLGTLGCISRCPRGGAPRLNLFPGMRESLARLATRARLEALPVANEATTDEVDVLLRGAGLNELMTPCPAQLPLASDTHFEVVAREAKVYVSASPQRRAEAAKAGLVVAPHPDLAASVLDGDVLVYAKISSDAALPDLLALQLPLLPLHADRNERASLLFGVGPYEPLSRCDGVTMLEGTSVDTDALYFLAHADAEGRDAEFDWAKQRAHFFERTRRGAVFAVRSPGLLAEDLPAPSCHTLLMELQPRLAERCARPFRAWRGGTALSPRERTHLETLDEVLLRRCLTPWWHELGALPDETDGVQSRHVLHADNPRVVSALATLLRRTCGASNVWCESARDLGRVFENVVAELPAAADSPFKDEVVVLSAHLDSIANNSDCGRDRAPGVDDDASGIAGVLAAAEVLGAMPGRRLRTIRFVLFNAEELYMRGSTAYARCHAADPAQIVAVIQLDMIGGRIDDCPSECVEIHSLPGDGGGGLGDETVRIADLVEQAFAELLGARLRTRRCPTPETRNEQTTDQTDTISFLAECIPACWVCEDMHDGCTSKIRNRAMHTTRDLHVNCAYAADIARAAAGAVWLRANAPQP
ncbi:M20/M25/M40 family metallo-hydrolase [bacterium]|nr:M20/M25/M40 family metallo-hydrolase [bacterium]